MTRSYSHWINGAHVPPASGQWIDTTDPYRGEVWARIPAGNATDANHAVASAKAAMTTGLWARMTPSERGRILAAIADLVHQHAEHLATLAQPRYAFKRLRPDCSSSEFEVQPQLY